MREIFHTSKGLKRVNRIVPLLLAAAMLSMHHGFAQKQGQDRIDSLKNILKTAKDDTNKVNILNSLSKQFNEINRFDEALQHAEIARSLSRKIDFKKGEANAFNVIGNINLYQNKDSNALINFLTALSIYEIINDRNGIAISYNNIALIYDDQGRYNESVKYFLAAIKINEGIGNKYRLANSYGNMGYVYRKMGNFSEALESQFKALKIREEIGDKEGVAMSYVGIGLVYENQADYPNALKYNLSALKIYEESGFKGGIESASINIGIIYYAMGNYVEAIKIYDAALKIAEEIGDKDGAATLYLNIAGAYHESGNDSAALKYYFLSLKIATEINHRATIEKIYNSLGTLYQGRANHSEALKYYYLALQIQEEIGSKPAIAKSYSYIGIVYCTMGEYQKSLSWLNKGLRLASDLKLKPRMRDAYLALAQVHDSLKDYKNAYLYYKAGSDIKETIFNGEKNKQITEMKTKYETEKKDNEIQLLNKDKEIQLKEIQKQKLTRNAIAGGASILVVSSLISFFFYKRRRDAIEQQKEAEFKNEVSDVEMKALRAQMNPHFIFNSLNSIHRFIQLNNTDEASEYLIKFSKLMRLILDSSRHKEVLLQKDLDALRLYMELESARLNHKFTFEIKTGEDVDAENIMIPPLILQPFVENAIWHGMANKEGVGKITVRINKEDEMISCLVEDNGIGREKAMQLKSSLPKEKHESLGMKITNDRINILNRIKKSKAYIALTDLYDESKNPSGTRVEVKLPLELSF